MPKRKKQEPEARAEYRSYWGLTIPFSAPSGVCVNEFTILKVAAVMACARYIATSIAQVDFNVYERLGGGGKVYRPDSPVDWILDREANNETPAMVFWETMLLHAIVWGNAYARIHTDIYGRILGLWQQTPDRVQFKRAEQDYVESGVGVGEQYYEVNNGDGSMTKIPASKMFHLRGISWDGQLGYNIARICQEVFGGPLAAQAFANAFFNNDATPGFALSTEKSLSEPAIKRLVASQNRGHRGPHNAQKFAVYEEGLRPFKLGANAEETQLVEVQQFYVEQVARVFGVPLTKIGHMLHSGNRANMEEDDHAAYKQCLRPWARKIECEADVKLFGRVNKGKLFTLHDFSPLLRGNSQQMTNEACQLLDRGVLKINEARDIFDLNPITEAEGGDTRPFPRNFTVLEKAGEDPPAASGGGSSGDVPGGGRNNKPPGGAAAMLTDADAAQAVAMPAQVRATFGVLLGDAYGRLLRVEADKARRAGNKDQLGHHIVGYYTDDGLRNVADAIRPVLVATMLAVGRSADGADGLAKKFAEDHATRSIRELSDGSWLAQWANGRAAHQAEEHLQALWESNS